MRYQTLEQFVAGPERNTHIRFAHLVSYVRKGLVNVDGRTYRALTRANTKSTRRGRTLNLDFNPRRRSTGEYRQLDEAMLRIAAEAGYEGVYVECVVNSFLPAKLLSWGYVRVNEAVHLEGSAPCYWRPVPA